MEALRNISMASTLDTFVSLTTAFVLGGLIGFERQYRQRTAGLRTNVLVAVGAATFVDLANRLHGHDGAVHVIAYVVSGVGFLGAGVIMRGEGSVRGLNTAATLWGSASVGAAAGADLIVEAVITAMFVLAANTVLRPIVEAVNRKPLDVESTEVTNTIYVIADRADKGAAKALLDEELDRERLPARSVNVHAFGAGEIEIEARLAAASVDGAVLDSLVERLASLPNIKQAFWSASTSE